LGDKGEDGVIVNHSFGERRSEDEGGDSQIVSSSSLSERPEIDM